VRELRHASEQNSFPASAEHVHGGWAHFFSAMIPPGVKLL
jgi:hypothetical protein